MDSVTTQKAEIKGAKKYIGQDWSHMYGALPSLLATTT
jgi:hypothetical protein